MIVLLLFLEVVAVLLVLAEHLEDVGVGEKVVGRASISRTAELLV